MFSKSAKQAWLGGPAHRLPWHEAEYTAGTPLFAVRVGLGFPWCRDADPHLSSVLDREFVGAGGQRRYLAVRKLLSVSSRRREALFRKAEAGHTAGEPRPGGQHLGKPPAAHALEGRRQEAGLGPGPGLAVAENSGVTGMRGPAKGMGFALYLWPGLHAQL